MSLFEEVSLAEARRDPELSIPDTGGMTHLEASRGSRVHNPEDKQSVRDENENVLPMQCSFERGEVILVQDRKNKQQCLDQRVRLKRAKVRHKID